MYNVSTSLCYKFLINLSLWKIHLVKVDLVGIDVIHVRGHSSYAMTL